MRFLMKPESVLIAIFRPSDGRVQDHKGHSEKQQTADEEKHDHGLRKP